MISQLFIHVFNGGRFNLFGYILVAGKGNFNRVDCVCTYNADKNRELPILFFFCNFFDFFV